MSEVAAVRSDRAARIPTAGLARLVALLLPLTLLAGAYGSQYFGGLYPCEMCWWQRYAHFAALVFAVPAFRFPVQSRASRTLVLLAALAIAVSGAIGVYHAASQAGLRIPQDLSVVGFDDYSLDAWLVPPLTTVRQPLSDMGAAAARMVLELARGDQLRSRRRELATELIVRSSTAPPAH